MLNIAVCVSGGGTNLQAIIDRIADGTLADVKIAGVISNNGNAYALERARNAGIPAFCVSPKDYETRDAFHKALAKSLQFNCIDCPDLVPTFAVAAAAARVKATLKGVSNIALKESDRMQAISTELQRMGGKVNCTAEEMVILPSELHPVEPVHTWGDHRIAMAFAPLKLRFPDLQIENPEVVEKSFPEFWEQFDLVLQNKQ